MSFNPNTAERNRSPGFIVLINPKSCCLRVIDSAGSDSIFAENVLNKTFRDIWHNPLKCSQSTFESAQSAKRKEKQISYAGSQ